MPTFIDPAKGLPHDCEFSSSQMKERLVEIVEETSNKIQSEDDVLQLVSNVRANSLINQNRVLSDRVAYLEVKLAFYKERFGDVDHLFAVYSRQRM